MSSVNLSTTIQFQGFDAYAGDALVFLSLDSTAPATGIAAVDNWAAALYSSGEFSGKPNELAILHAPAGLAAKRAILIGAGKSEKLDAAAFRRLGGAIVRSLKVKNILSTALVLDSAWQSPANVQALVEGALLGDFETDANKSKRDLKHAVSFTLIAANPTDSAALSAAARDGAIIGEAQNFARTLINEPGNLLPPLVLAERARNMAQEVGLDCEVLDEAKMRQLGMGSLLCVSQGSAEPPALIILKYTPAAGAVPNVHLGLVGKGVTFDTGGISIKPADSMEKMKYDMAGGAAVIGAMRAIAALKPNVEVTAFVPSVENMPSDRAVRPGDIVTSLSGKTIEVINTDAEGRLILIDAITYAKQQGVTHMVDAATLTGAIGIALGGVNAGAFSNNQAWQSQVLAAAAQAGEKIWPMPMDDDYKELLKNPYADMPNIGNGRGGGSITAALFLQEWVEDTPWVHLDIAGTAWVDEPKPFLAKGPTGISLRTFVALAQRLAANS
jgi:leucyl aminopeptidase